MGDVVIVKNAQFIQALRNLYKQGEITLEQFAGCLRRARERGT